MEARDARKHSKLARCAAVGLLCLTRAFAAGADSADSAVSHEYEIKAAFLFNFTRFIEWPSFSFADAASPIVIGVIGTDPFGGTLPSIVQGRRVNGRPIVARHVTRDEEARTTHLLFVGLTKEEDIARLMRALSGYPVTTVGESPAFAAQGGTITFVLQGDKVRFEINAATAAQAHVRISAQLEKLATVVRRTLPAEGGACCATSRSGEN
jgi:hypothetical protein